jgi:hypothetical protein
MVPWNNDATKVFPALKPISSKRRTRDAKSRSTYSAISKACDFSRGLDRVGLVCFALAVLVVRKRPPGCEAGGLVVVLAVSFPALLPPQPP